MHLRAAEALVLLELASSVGMPSTERRARKRMDVLHACMALDAQEESGTSGAIPPNGCANGSPLRKKLNKRLLELSLMSKQGDKRQRTAESRKENVIHM